MAKKHNDVLDEAVEIAKAIGYTDSPEGIHNPYLFIQAITHSSYASEHPDAEDNELLEFIGDEVLDASVTRLLLSATCGIYDKKVSYFVSNFDEGDFTSLKQELVDGTNLSKVARKLQLGKHLKLGKSAESQHIRNNAGILENLVEALIGAVALDTACDTKGNINIDKINHSKIDKVIRYILDFDHFIEGILSEEDEASNSILTEEDFDNPKNALNKLYTKGIIDQPRYGVVDYKIDEYGKDIWRCYCKINNANYNSKNFYFKKKDSEREAAAIALNEIINSIPELLGNL